jgi:hypothetical protein
LIIKLIRIYFSNASNSLFKSCEKRIRSR